MPGLNRQFGSPLASGTSFGPLPQGGIGRRFGDSLLAEVFRQRGPQGAPTGPPPPGGQQNIGTSITPRDLFPEDFTRRAGNLLSALSVPARADLMHAGTMKGVSSYSPMTQWDVGARYADAMGQALLAPQRIGLEHGFANAQQRLQSESAREQEALGWGRLGLQDRNNLLGLLAYFM